MDTFLALLFGIFLPAGLVLLFIFIQQAKFLPKVKFLQKLRTQQPVIFKVSTLILFVGLIVADLAVYAAVIV